MAIVNLVEKITNSLDNTNTVVCVFINLRKAFGTIDHTILLQKLNHYGICGIGNQWVSSYLAQEAMCTLSSCVHVIIYELSGEIALKKNNHYYYIKRTESFLEHILCGDPHGSILGTRFFNLYLNDICNASSILEFTLFADETILFTAMTA